MQALIKNRHKQLSEVNYSLISSIEIFIAANYDNMELPSNIFVTLILINESMKLYKYYNIICVDINIFSINVILSLPRTSQVSCFYYITATCSSLINHYNYFRIYFNY